MAISGTRPWRSSVATASMLLPAGLWYALLLLAPLVILTVFSFGNRAP